MQWLQLLALRGVAPLLRNDYACGRQVPDFLDQVLIVDPHRRAEQDRSKRPEPPPSRLSQVDEVVNTINESSKDVATEERAVWE